MGARIREVEQGPDGEIYLLEDGESAGRLLRLDPRLWLTVAAVSRPAAAPC